MHTLGIPASTGKVFASTDSNVTVLETRSAQSDVEDGQDVDYLVLYWGTAPNAFEGYCEVNSKQYAVWPKCTGTSPLDLLRRLGSETNATQRWVHMRTGWTPGDIGWASPQNLLFAYPGNVNFP